MKRIGNFDSFAHAASGAGSVLVLLLGLAALPGVGHASHLGGRIVFGSTRDGNSEIYVMNADGTNQTRVSFHAANDQRPLWSPDGSQIVFTSDRDGNRELYLMRPDGTGLLRLTNYAGPDDSAAWLPNGKLVFQRDDNIYTMNSDGSGIAPLATGSANEGQPNPSPDGSKVVYTHSTFFADHQLFIMNIDGTGQALLPPNILPINTTGPDWSPLGQRIAFEGTIPGSAQQIYLVNADGTGGLTQLTTSGANFQGNFSSDGSHIVFMSTRDGVLEIYSMDADGQNQVRLTTSGGNSDPDMFVAPEPATWLLLAVGLGYGWRRRTTCSPTSRS